MPPTANTYRPNLARHRSRAATASGPDPAASANRAASTPFGITVAVMPQPALSSAATAADTHTCATGNRNARSWHATSSGVVNVSR
jgi:hypothetical protein